MRKEGASSGLQGRLQYIKLKDKEGMLGEGGEEKRVKEERKSRAVSSERPLS